MVRAIYALTSLLGLAAAVPVAAPEAKPDLSDASNEVESGFQKFEHFFDARDPGLQSLEDGAKHAADNFASVFTGKKDNSKRGFSFESMGQDIKNGVDNAAGDAKKAITGSSKRDFSFESMGQDIKNGVDNAAGDAKKAFTGKNDKR